MSILGVTQFFAPLATGHSISAQPNTRTSQIAVTNKGVASETEGKSFEAIREPDQVRLAPPSQLQLKINALLQEQAIAELRVQFETQLTASEGRRDDKAQAALIGRSEIETKRNDMVPAIPNTSRGTAPPFSQDEIVSASNLAISAHIADS